MSSDNITDLAVKLLGLRQNGNREMGNKKGPENSGPFLFLYILWLTNLSILKLDQQFHQDHH